MTFADMQAEVSRRLAEVSGHVFWSATDISDAINLGYAELADATEWNEQWVDLDLLRDRPYYDLRTIIGSTFLAVRPGFDRQTNRWLTPTSVRGLDGADRRWEAVTGEPQRVFTRGLWWLALYPRLQAETGQIKQYYVALPTPLSDDTDEPGFPEPFHYGCVDFACSDLWAQDGETALALSAWTAYLATETALAGWVAHRTGAPMARGFDGTSVPR